MLALYLHHTPRAGGGDSELVMAVVVLRMSVCL
jgi:hypothetical protein